MQQSPPPTEICRSIGLIMDSRHESYRLAGITHPLLGEIMIFVTQMTPRLRRRFLQLFDESHGDKTPPSHCVVCFASGSMATEQVAGEWERVANCLELPHPWCTDVFVRGRSSSTLARIVKAASASKEYRILHPRSCSRGWLETNVENALNHPVLSTCIQDKTTKSQCVGERAAWCQYWENLDMPQSRPTELELLLGRDEFLRVTQPLLRYGAGCFNAT